MTIEKEKIGELINEFGKDQHDTGATEAPLRSLLSTSIISPLI